MVVTGRLMESRREEHSPGQADYFFKWERFRLWNRFTGNASELFRVEPGEFQ